MSESVCLGPDSRKEGRGGARTPGHLPIVIKNGQAGHQKEERGRKEGERRRRGSEQQSVSPVCLTTVRTETIRDHRRPLRPAEGIMMHGCDGCPFAYHYSGRVSCLALFFFLFPFPALFLLITVVHFVQAFDSGLQSLHKLPVEEAAASAVAMDGSIARNEFYWTLTHCPDFFSTSLQQRLQQTQNKKKIFETNAFLLLFAASLFLSPS